MPQQPPTGLGAGSELVAASPRASRLVAPRWLDLRLVLGILLILVSVVVGARVLAGADASVPVYVLTRDLAAGTVLAPGDLQVQRVRLFADGDRYVSAAGGAPTGYVLLRALGGREFLPRAALTAQRNVAQVRTVTLPVRRNHLPIGLRHGDLVDVFIAATAAPPARSGSGGSATSSAGTATSSAGTATTSAGSAAVAGSAATRGRPQRVLAAVPVEAVSDGAGRLGGSDETGVVLRVPAALVPAAVAAAQSGTVDLVRLPTSTQSGVAPAPALGTG